MGNYRLTSAGTTSTSPAFNAGAASKAVPSYQQPAAVLAAPATDIDNQARPANGGYDIGADEVPGPGGGAQADLSITKTDGATSAYTGNRVTYTIVVRNSGPSAVTGASVTDTMPAALTGVSWTCAAIGTGTSCGTGGASGTGNINRAVNLGTTANNRVTYTVVGTLLATATGTLENTATVTAPAGTNDPNPSNNSATDIDQILVAPTLPTLGLLDNFNRTNAANLGTNWSQTTATGTVIRVNGNQAQCALLGNCVLGTAMWNATGSVFGATQGAAFTFTSLPLASLYLKASGGSANAPASYLRVRAVGATAVVETTTNSGGAFTTTATFAGANFANGDRLSAVANADGSVDVWKTTVSSSVTTYLGHSTPTAAFTGTGRIGMQLLIFGTVDNFSGGTLLP